MRTNENFEVLETGTLQAVEGGVTEGGCIVNPLEKFLEKISPQKPVPFKLFTI